MIVVWRRAMNGILEKYQLLPAIRLFAMVSGRALTILKFD